MNHERFDAWLRNIYETQDVEISCSECFDLVSHFVELEASGVNAEAKMPRLKQHLNQCQACRDEYEMLLALARFENEGGVPSLGDLRKSIR